MAFVLKVFSAMAILLSSVSSGVASLHHTTSQTANQTVYQTVGNQELSGSVNDARLLYPALRPTPAPKPVPAPPVASAPAPAPAPAPVVHTVVISAPKPPPFVTGSEQQVLINQDRRSAGEAPVNWSSCLASIAAAQAQAMANSESIYHGAGVQEDFNCRLGSVQTGENVGVWGGGINDAMINTLFMGSPDHRANILGPYHYVGTAWALGKNGCGYIAVEFA